MNISSSATAPTTAGPGRHRRERGPGRRAVRDDRLRKIGQEPVKLHFPWLSRLATKLEAVSQNHWPFKSVPVTGENINNAA